GEFIRANRKALRACSDLSDGGLALAAFEMAEAAGLGVTLAAADIATLFGEDQARYLVACAPEEAAALEAAARAGAVPTLRAGIFGGSTVGFGTDTAPLADLSALYRSAFAAAVG
uniref:AIR synthase-related protein n=1 Tax=Tabrizicola sp. TaxID=2005166 RepID=UPI00286D5F80